MKHMLFPPVSVIGFLIFYASAYLSYMLCRQILIYDIAMQQGAVHYHMQESTDKIVRIKGF